MSTPPFDDIKGSAILIWTLGATRAGFSNLLSEGDAGGSMKIRAPVVEKTLFNSHHRKRGSASTGKKAGDLRA